MLCEKEISEFKTVKLCRKTDLVSYPVRVEVLGKKHILVYMIKVSLALLGLALMLSEAKTDDNEFSVKKNYICSCRKIATHFITI